MIKDKLIPLPPYEEQTLYQQTFISLSTAHQLIIVDNIDIRLKAISEALGIKYKNKE